MAELLTKTAYCFDDEYLYTGQTREAVSPPNRPDEWATRAWNSTVIVPPETGDKEIVKFIIDYDLSTDIEYRGVWEIVPDHRGEMWFDDAAGGPIAITFVGDPADNGLIPEIPISQLIAKKCREIDAQRDLELASGLEVTSVSGTYIYKTDSESCKKIMTAFVLARYYSSLPLDFEREWTDINGVPVNLVADDFYEIAKKLENKMDSLHRQARTMKSEVRALIEREDINNYEISFN